MMRTEILHGTRRKTGGVGDRCYNFLYVKCNNITVLILTPLHVILLNLVFQFGPAFFALLYLSVRWKWFCGMKNTGCHLCQLLFEDVTSGLYIQYTRLTLLGSSHKEL
jgi:hypothetical protein